MKYCVDIFRVYAKCVDVEADSEAEAEEIAYQNTLGGIYKMNEFELTDDVDTRCSGIVNEEGEHEYF